MMIIFGLGNPGEKFKNTKHNVGFMVVDFFAEKNGFPEFKLSKKYNSFISEKIYSNVLQNIGVENDPAEQKIILIKPHTFMNESGKAIKKISKSYKLKAISLVVVHDDIDLSLGKLKISKDSGAGGHKGVDSIIHSLGTKDFIRLRIGICPLEGKPITVEKFVIQKFKEEEKETIEKILVISIQALSFFLENGLEKTMNKFN